MAQQVKSTLQEDSRKFLHQPRQTGLMEEHLRTLLRGCPVVTGEEPGPGNGRKFVKEEMALGGKGCSQLQGRRGSHLQQVQGAAGSGRHRPGQILALKQWDPSKYWKPCWQEFFNCLVNASSCHGTPSSSQASADGSLPCCRAHPWSFMMAYSSCTLDKRNWFFWKYVPSDICNIISWPFSLET